MIKVLLVLTFLWIALVMVLFRCNEVSANPRDVQYHTDHLPTLIQDAVNDYRTDNGLSPLTWNEYWVDTAKDHSVDLVTSNSFSHTGSDGRTFQDRIEQRERNEGHSGCYAKGENLVKRYVREGTSKRDFADAMVQQWIGSQGHRENMLRPMFTSASVGVAYGTNDRGRRFVIATHLFCAR